MTKPFTYFVIYLLALALGTSLSAATFGAGSPEAAPEDPAPARKGPIRAASHCVYLPCIVRDSLPAGRHQVNSFRNGESTEFIVEDGEIKSLKINGEVIPPEDFDQHLEMVESMLGGGRFSGSLPGFRFDVMRDFEDFHGEDMEKFFERQGREWERMGEEMRERFDDMFQFDQDGHVFRFNFDGTEGGIFEFNLDSMMQGRQQLFPQYQREYDLEDILREKENELRDPEEEIEELETMIERMERRKADVKREIEAERGGVSLNGYSFQRGLSDLRDKGLIEPGVIRSFEFSQRSLKVNGKKASAAAHEALLGAYREATGSDGKFSIALDGLEI